MADELRNNARPPSVHWALPFQRNLSARMAPFNQEHPSGPSDILHEFTESKRHAAALSRSKSASHFQSLSFAPITLRNSSRLDLATPFDSEMQRVRNAFDLESSLAINRNRPMLMRAMGAIKSFGELEVLTEELRIIAYDLPV
ncbi:hypothetical protein QFC20_004874 [Naganishia adeliensis]|uniref:Uncharacterized protein n=1 Tax=Naganishia adeliensis TaxID=92952 RepID=A0ACC2VU30_9TREE|nr:hypothetical protein QFC20_004874 [Naganishia adeliensis]